jgi:ligand-binding sensor domain-containing protein
MIPAAFRRVRALCWTALGIFFAASNAPAADSAWLTRVWQIEDGLPQNHVNDVAQGPDGQLWVSTANGLAKFDGVRFTKFSYRREDEGSEQGVRMTLRGRDHGLWIVPMRGAPVHLNADCSEIFSTATGLPGSQTAVNFVEDDAGTLWLARSSTRTVVQIKNGQVAELGESAGVPANGGIFSLTKDAAGTVWLAKGHAAGIFRGNRFEPLGDFKSNVRLAPARTNGVWLGAGTKLFKCDAGGRVQNFGALPADNARTFIVKLLEDRTGALWIGTDTSGLFRFDGAHFEKVETSDTSILSLTEDREGNLWVGTSGGGLNRISPRRVRLENFDDDTAPVAMQSVCEDARGTLWAATTDGRIVCRRDGRWTVPFTNQIEPVLSVDPRETILCIAGATTGFPRWMKKTGLPVRISPSCCRRRTEICGSPRTVPTP